VRCFSREELTTVAAFSPCPPSTGKNFAIVTHAGGPGVMLTDALSKAGLNVPKLEGNGPEEIKAQLFRGAAVSNTYRHPGHGHHPSTGCGHRTTASISLQK
jgi:acetyltransferase